MSEVNRRQHPRHRLHFEMHVVHLDVDEPFEETVLLRDISDGGLSFITKNPERFDINQRLSIALHQSSRHVSRHLEGVATIRWLKHCDHAMNQAFVGVQLDDLIESECYIPA